MRVLKELDTLANSSPCFWASFSEETSIKTGSLDFSQPRVSPFWVTPFLISWNQRTLWWTKYNCASELSSKKGLHLQRSVRDQWSACSFYFVPIFHKRLQEQEGNFSNANTSGVKSVLCKPKSTFMITWFHIYRFPGSQQGPYYKYCRGISDTKIGNYNI